jgi:exonuclease SbcC
MAALKECGIQVYDKDTDSALGKRTKAIDARLVELASKEQQGQDLEAEVKKARTTDTNAGTAQEKAQGAFAEAEKKVNDANAELNKTTALKEARKKDVVAAVEVVKSIVKGTKWQDVWSNDRDGFWKELCDAVATHKEAIQKQTGLLEEKRTVSTTARTVKGVLSEIETMVPTWKAIEALPAKELSSLEETAKNLKDDLLIETQNVNNADKAANQAASKVDTFLSGNQNYDREKLMQLSAYTQETIEAIEKHQKDLGESLIAADASVKTLTKQANEHAAKRPEFEEGETQESLEAKVTECDDTILDLNSKATLLDQELETDTKNAEKVGDLAAEAESLRQTWVKWDRLNNLVGDATGNKFRKVAQSYVLGSLVTAANHYMRELTDRYALKVVPGTFIISVEDAYQGYASRPASTISGGESFLVSLSLALALSDIGDTLSVDTIFIDEGFGTLSGVPLQNAVNTLKSLRTKAGRHVGIISHIEELQEKIPVRIQVEKSERTSSSSVRVVPEE